MCVCVWLTNCQARLATPICVNLENIMLLLWQFWLNPSVPTHATYICRECVYECVCVCVFVCIRIHAREYVWHGIMHVSMHVSLYICHKASGIRLCIKCCVCMYFCMQVFMCLSAVSDFVHTYTSKHTRVFTYTCTHLWYIYVQVFRLSTCS